MADYLKVCVSTVSNFRRRELMPQPGETFGRTHLWGPRRIVEWHEKRPRPGVGGRPAHNEPADEGGAE